jgi:hypothetical protein
LNVLADKRFHEHDLVMSESGFWHQLMHLNVLCLPDILKIMNRDTKNKISLSVKIEYCRGKTYCIVYAISEDFSKRDVKNQFWLAAKYHRYCIHGDIEFKTREKLFRGSKNLMYYLGAVCGYLQAFKDYLQRRVVKTHKVFEKGRNATYFIMRNFA